MSSPTEIYTGTWTDWSYGRIIGRRVTMSSNCASTLIAFVAIFDGFVGTVFWNLLSFTIHQMRAKDNIPRDGLAHQLRVLLRSANEPFSYAQDVVRVGWRWRKTAPRVFLRTALFAILAVSTSLVFSAVGVLSAKISSNGNVLLTGGSCGFYDASSGDTTVQSYVAALLDDSMEYAQSCYINQSNQLAIPATTSFSPGSTCEFYTRPTLDWITTIGTQCPFKKSCGVPDSEVIKLDTGLLSTNDDLGVNLQPTDNVLFRRVETCSPLTTRGFSNNTFTPTTRDGQTANFALYSYGPQYWINNIVEVTIEWIEQNNVTFYYPQDWYNAADSPYNLLTASNFNNPNVSEQTYFPDPRITDPWVPISLFFLANRADYVDGPIEDPWFEAMDEQLSNPYNFTGTNSIFEPYYYNSKPGSVLACVEQLQICNPNVDGSEPICTDLNSWWTKLLDPPEMAFEGLGFNPLQLQIADNLLFMLQNSMFLFIAALAGQKSLVASSLISQPFGGFSPALPANQWQIEVENWMAISMSNLQRANLASVTGTTSKALLTDWVYCSSENATQILGSTSAELSTQLCQVQKVNMAGYQSFSVLGLAVNFAIGGAIILARLITKYVIPAIDDRRHKSAFGSPRRQDWILDGPLQLQRMAYEELGLGHWKGVHTVPVTGKGQKFQKPRFVSCEGVPVIEGVPTCSTVDSRPDLDQRADHGKGDRREPEFGTINALSGSEECVSAGETTTGTVSEKTVPNSSIKKVKNEGNAAGDSD